MPSGSSEMVCMYQSTECHILDLLLCNFHVFDPHRKVLKCHTFRSSENVNAMVVIEVRIVVLQNTAKC
jgi:hypothetical protein